MKHIDVEETRVVTNDKHIAEQIKSDSTLPARECLLNRKVESTVMDGVKSWKIWKSGEGTKFEERRDGWSQKWKIWKIGKLLKLRRNDESK